MSFRVPAVYEKGVLRLLEPLDIPEHTVVTVTVSEKRDREKTSKSRVVYPTRPQPISSIEQLIGIMPAGGDAVKDADALYDQDW